MRTEEIEYLGERFEVVGFYIMPTQNRDTGEKFGACFEIDEIIWVMDAETNTAIYVDVMPTMSADIVEEIGNIVLTNIKKRDD